MAEKNYPDYLGCCHRFDYNVGRLVDTLKEQGMENTILAYTADHGSHFLTRGREAEINARVMTRRSISR